LQDLQFSIIENIKNLSIECYNCHCNSNIKLKYEDIFKFVNMNFSMFLIGIWIHKRLKIMGIYFTKIYEVKKIYSNKIIFMKANL
jgi:hypothetical protein